MATSVIFCSEEHGAFYWIYFWHSIGIKYRRRQPCYLLSEPPLEDSFLPIQEAEHWGTMESPKLLLHGSCHVLTPLKQCRNAAWCHGNFQHHDLAHAVSTTVGERKDASESNTSSRKLTKLVYLCNAQGISEGRTRKKFLPARTRIVTCDLLGRLGLSPSPIRV